MDKYPLVFDNREVGSVTVDVKGLYYHFLCVCNIATNIASRICVHCGDRITDLGICVPEKGSYILRKQIPVKRIGDGELLFFIENKKQLPDNSDIICADKPFEKIASLEKSKMIVMEGKHYIYWD